MTQKITPCLWFDGNADEAAAFYTSIFKNSEVGSSSKYDEKSAEVVGQKEGSTMVVEFEIAGQKFVGLNGGPQFKFNEAVSFMISCKDQAEIDYFWNRLTADGGEESQCCWLKDKFGLSWQVIPANLNKIIGGPDRAGAERATAALLNMRKPDIQTLQDAYDGKGE
jgi:predicted 3-demethylubiquinone-9 3-methyltransferase (glyoxalase superfamily)